MRRTPGLFLVVALLLAGCSSAPDAVPSATDFAVPTLARSGDMQRASACSKLGDRPSRVSCLLPVAEALLARVYAPIVESRGLQFTRPKVISTGDSTQTACGLLNRIAYCPDDGTIFLLASRLDTLGDSAATNVEWGPQTLSYFTEVLTPEDLRAGGAYGAVMALAHEYAHHVQTLLGYERVNTYEMTNQPEKAAYYSSEFELMADCFAGWAAAVLNEQREYRLRPIDQWAAVTALAEVGDDFIQESRGGSASVAPQQSFNHGAANERANAWVQGVGFGIDAKEPFAACLALADTMLDGRSAGS